MYRHIQTSLYLKGTDCLQKSSLLEPNKVKWSKETTNLKHRQPIKSVDICAKKTVFTHIRNFYQLSAVWDAQNHFETCSLTVLI